MTATEELKEVIRALVEEFEKDHPDLRVQSLSMWRERRAGFINADRIEIRVNVKPK